MVTGEYRAACRPHVHVIHVQSEARRVLEAAFLCLSCWGREGYLKLQGRWNRCNIDLAVEAAKSLQSGTYQCVPLFFQAFFLLVVGRCIETQDTVQTQKCQANVMWTRLFHHICPFYQSYFFYWNLLHNKVLALPLTICLPHMKDEDACCCSSRHRHKHCIASKLKLKTDRKFIAHSIVGKTNAIYEEVGVRKLFQRLCHQLLRTPEAEHT